MEPESYLLVIAVVLLILDFALVRGSKVKRKQATYGFYACVFSFSLILISYFSFVIGFLTSDFSFQQVYLYSSSSMSTLSKLYATWAGSGGSILLLIIFTSMVWFCFRTHGYRKQNKTNFFASIILGVVVVFFVLAAIMMNPFVRYTDVVPVEGRGLNPVLQSGWMAVHPPIVFGGYVFVLLAFALTLAKMRTGIREYEKLFNFSVRAAWLLLTLGIALGGIWAYEVLGWGGYWSWDPIETASLLPWIALTLYFIVQSISKSKKSLLSEFTILLAFASLMFLSALTRGGLLQSVHAYGLSTAGPFILLFASGMILYFFYLKKTVSKPLFFMDFDKRSLRSVSLALGFFSLIGVFLVCFLGIVYPMVERLFVSNAPVPGVDFYNYWNFPFVVGFVFALIGYGICDRCGLKALFALVLIIAVVGAVFAFVRWPTNNVLANVGLPLLAVGLFTGLLSLGSSLKLRSVNSVGRALIHVGVMVVLIGVIFSATSQQVSTVRDIRLGSTFQAVGLSIKILDCSIGVNNDTIEIVQGVFPQGSRLQLNAIISDGSASYNTQFCVDLYTAYGLVNKPTIIRTGTDDIYILTNVTQDIYDALLNSLVGSSSQPETFVVMVERIPMINVIWVGVAVLIIGCSIPLVVEATSGERQSKQYSSKSR